MDDRTVGEVAKATGLTVRTLHHYDEIGLVTPSGRSASGYRLYSEADVERLHAVCTYRELGLSLEAIGELLADGDVGDHLRRQHRVVTERIARLREVQLLIDTMLEARAMDISLTDEEVFEIFGGHDPDEHRQEAEQRWGQTEAFKESSRRVRRYGAEEWRQIKAESEAIEGRFADLLRQGAGAEAPECRAVAEQHREHIDQWFYPCSHQMHRGLADLYESDARFAEHYDSREPGLSHFVSAAIRSNADAVDAGAVDADAVDGGASA